MPSLDKSLINQGDTLIVGVSGGIDSVVLLHLLNAVKSPMNLSLVVAHMNYKMRPTSDDDQSFTEKLAESMAIPFESTEFNPSGTTGNFQNKARKARYRFFCELAEKHHADKICVAHHADDQAETVMIRLLRGSDLEGYAGMKNHTTMYGHTLIRPMLHIPKEAIVAFANEKKYAYRTDASNEGDDYLRNRIRHHILPFFKKENPSFLRQNRQFSELMHEASAFIQTQRDMFIKNHVEDNRFHRKPYNKLSDIVKRSVLQKMVRDLSDHRYDLSHEKTNQAIDMIEKDTPHLHFQIEDDIYMHKSYDDIWFDHTIDEPTDYQFEMDKPGTCDLPGPHSLILSENPVEERGKMYKLWYNDFDSVFPVTIRNRRDGDCVRYPFGTKKVKDVFIDRKVPMEKRNRLPVIMDKTGTILFIPGIYAKKTTGKNLMRFYYQERNR